MADDARDTRDGHRIATLGEPRGVQHARREQRLRRVGIALLAVVVAAALSGLLGTRRAVVDVADGLVSMSVDYVQVTRPGIEAPLTVRVDRDGGFDGPVVLEFEIALFERLDFQSWYPTPSAETADGRFVRYEFDPPAAGDTFTATLDAHTQSTQGPSVSTYTVVLTDGDRRPAADLRMWVLP